MATLPQVRQNFTWAATVPEEIWLDYVLPYASVNEARTDWRRLLPLGQYTAAVFRGHPFACSGGQLIRYVTMGIGKLGVSVGPKWTKYVPKLLVH